MATVEQSGKINYIASSSRLTDHDLCSTERRTTRGVDHLVGGARLLTHDQLASIPDLRMRDYFTVYHG